MRASRVTDVTCTTQASASTQAAISHRIRPKKVKKKYSSKIPLNFTHPDSPLVVFLVSFNLL